MLLRQLLLRKKNLTCFDMMNDGASDQNHGGAIICDDDFVGFLPHIVSKSSSCQQAEDTTH